MRNTSNLVIFQSHFFGLRYFKYLDIQKIDNNWTKKARQSAMWKFLLAINTFIEL